MILVYLNAAIAVLCGVIAIIEFVASHNAPAALAYTGFGLGYVGLSWVYWNI